MEAATQTIGDGISNKFMAVSLKTEDVGQTENPIHGTTRAAAAVVVDAVKA